MGYNMKRGNSAVPFKELGSSPAKFDIKSEKAKNKRDWSTKPVDPDAPGTPGTPGYEPPVRRDELDEKGKKIYDAHRAKKTT